MDNISSSAYEQPQLGEGTCECCLWDGQAPNVGIDYKLFLNNLYLCKHFKK